MVDLCSKRLPSNSKNRHNEISIISWTDHLGIPTTTIADLFLELCHILHIQTCLETSLSLVRRITNVEFLGVTFCRAQVECT